ncbi:DUF4874 domain-containing protein, partial [Herbaspirillum sp. GCM10030257]|uniref:DUF4874 domain-containing protein n=1 Tax=Herbaspirillum sp. GCM10030257 TaxID=3273393 RepID=UPI003606B6AB
MKTTINFIRLADRFGDNSRAGGRPGLLVEDAAGVPYEFNLPQQLPIRTPGRQLPAPTDFIMLLVLHLDACSQSGRIRVLARYLATGICCALLLAGCGERRESGKTTSQTDTPEPHSVPRQENTDSAASHAPLPGRVAKIKYGRNAAQIFNPERGLYRYVDCNSSVGASTLQSYRNEGTSLVYCIVNLSSFINSPISQTQLDLFQRRMDEFRSAGLKAIPRFVYSENEGG